MERRCSEHPLWCSGQLSRPRDCEPTFAQFGGVSFALGGKRAEAFSVPVIPMQ
jgi:hypothetical protein